MITNIFPTPVWNFKIEIPKDLIEKINSLKQSDPKGRVYSNSGGWQSNDIRNNPDFEEICKILYNLLPEVYKDVYTKPNGKISLGSIWVNINKGSDFNYHHVHPQSHISGCLYIKCNKKSGPINFKNPVGDLMSHYGLAPSTVNKNVLQWEIDYKPIEGDLILFPSWLYHSALPSEDDSERISIAFNTIINY